MRLLLISHAQTDWNVQARFQGHADIPLNEHGRRQALAWQMHLAQERLDAIWASDLARAAETAHIIGEPHHVQVQTDRRLRELHFGDWEGLTYLEIRQRFPDQLAAWERNYAQFAAPGGETLADLAQRLQQFVEAGELARPMGTALLVAHRGSLRALLCVLLNVPIARQWDYRLEIASLSEVIVNKEASVLKALNVTLDDA